MLPINVFMFKLLLPILDINLLKMLLVSEKWNPFIYVGEIHFQIVPNCYLIDCCFEMKRQPRLLVRLATARRQSAFLPPERQRQYHAFYSWPI